ncbi:DUF6880 family protein [Vacuolonema iberomarrocanum]|uniref:DUF6880 family protein n=1 Tax=Vacuolonema iberomarrocanum TaxID=3454632 RepID=UPI001A0F2DA7|nr:hypothetical protein [filamentous cyanobacterium LEGE 07170]
MKTLSDVLDQDMLRELAGDRYYERGVRYFEQGHVSSMAQYGDRIVAEVRGTESYQVQLWLQSGALLSRCSCPLGVDDLFCKHCVAVGLAWIAEPPLYQPEGNAPRSAGTTMEDVRDYLLRQSPETLVQMMLDQAMEDTRWRETLLLKAASNKPGGADINTFRRTLRNTIIPNDFVDYYDMRSYVAEVESVVNGLEDLLVTGYALDVVQLCEETVTLIEEAYNSVDDSSGSLGAVLWDVQALHLRACEQANPDPHVLAERLLRLELDLEYSDAFSNALEDYDHILGEPGRRTYGRLIDAELEKLLPPKPNEDFHRKYRRSQLLRMKEELVAAEGNVEDVVAVLASDLSEPSNYLRIAQYYQEAGQTETAIAWAEEGLEAFQDSYLSGRLGEFLVSAYEGVERFEDAVELVWQDFKRYSSLKNYQDLKQRAEKAGQWAHWRDRALTHLRENLARETTTLIGSHRMPAVGYSPLVEIFLWEGEVDQAWIEAQTGGCSKQLWMQLADQRAHEHPEDALSVYLPAIEPLIKQTSNDTYRQAVALLVKVKALMERIGCEDDFERRLATLATIYKRKRNFIKYLLDSGFQV